MKTIKKYMAIAISVLTLSGMIAQNRSEGEATSNLTTSNRMSAAERINYQAVARDAAGALMTNASLTIGFQIRNGAGGAAVFNETQNLNTDANGVFSAQIGAVASLAGIDWPNIAPWLEVTLNGTNVGETQMASVPYAFHAKTAESITGTTSLAIGQNYQGGIIFWLDATAQHGLIASTVDQSTGIRWDNVSGVESYAGSFGDGLYAGSMNTAIIIAALVANIQSGDFAAMVCSQYSVTDGGITYGDWYLPSNYELNLLYQQKAAVGGFANEAYKSSTEYSTFFAYVSHFDTGVQEPYLKWVEQNVRAIRAF